MPGSTTLTRVTYHTIVLQLCCIAALPQPPISQHTCGKYLGCSTHPPTLCACAWYPSSQMVCRTARAAAAWAVLPPYVLKYLGEGGDRR
jgi:hypothetical protein